MKGHSGTVAALLDNAATEIDTQGEVRIDRSTD